MASGLPSFFVALAGLFLALVLVALWNSLRGLLTRGEGGPVASAQSHAGREALMHQKNELLTAIRDVRSEHELGKLSLADAQQLEQRYRARARGVLRDLDQQLAPYRERARAMIEEAISVPASGAQSSASPGQVPGTALSCQGCGSMNDPDALFCKKCGKPMASGAGS